VADPAPELGQGSDQRGPPRLWLRFRRMRSEASLTLARHDIPDAAKCPLLLGRRAGIGASVNHFSLIAVRSLGIAHQRRLSAYARHVYSNPAKKNLKLKPSKVIHSGDGCSFARPQPL